jgi:hypothetical protein
LSHVHPYSWPWTWSFSGRPSFTPPCPSPRHSLWILRLRTYHEHTTNRMTHVKHVVGPGPLDRSCRIDTLGIWIQFGSALLVWIERYPLPNRTLNGNRYEISFLIFDQGGVLALQDGSITYFSYDEPI